MLKSVTQKNRSILSWCLFDAGNSAFATVIITFIYSVYFSRSVAADETSGSVLWSYAIAASGFLIAILSPFLGAVADHYGPRKPALILASFISIIACGLLYFVTPDPAFVNIMTALILVALANTAFEIALVFSNAMLPGLAPPDMIGRISGWAWAAGYAGGLACLCVVLVGFVGLGDLSPLIALPQEYQAHIRACAPVTAAWFLVFTLPLIFFCDDVAKTGLGIRQAIKKGISQLKKTMIDVRANRNILVFLAGSAVYRDGLNTLFAMGGIFAAGAFGMNFTEILVFAIGINVTAGIGAFLFAFADDFWGSRKTIMISLVGLIVTASVILMLTDKHDFIMASLVMGLFIGPAQAASRTLAARLSPPDQVAQTYGLYSLTGRVASFFGPLLFGIATSIFESQRAGFSTIIFLWLAGMAIIMMVKEKHA